MSTRRVPPRIGDLPPLGRPANSAMLAAGVTALAQVARLPEREVRAMHGVGPKAIETLGEALAARGMSFAP